MAKIVKVNNGVEFDDGSFLYSEHNQDCCEHHYLCFDDLKVDDFNHLEFDVTGESFFERVDGFGIRLVAVNGVAIPIPGYANNNGYHSSNLSLCLSNKKDNVSKSWDISECQDFED